MAVALNIPTPTTLDNLSTDVTPTGLAALTGQGTGKVTGSAGNDRGSLFDVQKDADQVVSMGGGDDVFVFSSNDTNVDLNGIVKMGDGGNDVVYLSHRIEDYIFTARLEGEGIKIQYIGEPDGKGDAVTFYGAESFVFRNIDPVSGDNFVNSTFTQDDLYAAILAIQI